MEWLVQAPPMSLTGIAYIRAVRYADGSVWNADPDQVIEAVRGLGIEVKELDETGPDSP